MTEKFRAIGRHGQRSGGGGLRVQRRPHQPGKPSSLPRVVRGGHPRQNVEILFRASRSTASQTTRAGAYKPRTSPYDFQGLGADCLPWVFELAGKYGIRIIAMEVTHESHIEEIQRALEGVGTRHRGDAPDRHPQRPELRAVEGGGPADGASRALQAGHGDHALRVPQRLRVRRLVGEPPDRLLPAGNEDESGRPPPQLRRFQSRARGPAAHAAAGLHRPLPLGGQPGRGPRRPARRLSHVTAQGVIAGANMVLVDFHPKPEEAALRRPAGAAHGRAFALHRRRAHRPRGLRGAHSARVVAAG